MSIAADLTTIRKALEWAAGHECAACDEKIILALAALDRIEQNTLSPEEAREIHQHFVDGAGMRESIWAKLERIAGDTGEAKELPPDARWALETLADRIERDERRPDPPRLTPRDFG